MMAKIEKDGLQSVIPLLEGESLFKLIAESRAGEEVKSYDDAA